MVQSKSTIERILVEKAYLMITTRCNVNCRFCIVRKTDEDMDPAIMRKAIDFVVDSAGESKKIAIYGGEPTVQMPGMMEVLRYAGEKKAASNKEIELYLYTNGFLLDRDLRAILKAHQVKVVFSLDISQQLMDESLWTDNHRRTFDRRQQNARELLKEVGPANVCAATVVLPQEVQRLREMYRYLTDDMGFEVVKFLPGLVRYRWTAEQIEALREQLTGLFADIVKKVLAGKNVYLDGINEALYRAEHAYPEDLLALSVLEFYPDGSFGMSPCEFEAPEGRENVNEIDQFILGSIDDLNAERIQSRAHDVLQWPKHSGLQAFSIWTERAAQSLIKTSQTNPRIEQYIRQARRLSFA